MNEIAKTLTSKEITLLLAQLLKNRGTRTQTRKSIRNWALAVLMLETGLRIAEVAGLRRADLWFNSQSVKSIIVRAEIAKNHIERQIPVSHLLSKAIVLMAGHNWSHLLGTNHWFAFYSHDPMQPMSPRQIERIIKDESKAALGREITPHILRHTFGTRLMRVTDIRTVQALLGHKHLSSTQIYTHPNGDDLKNAIDKI